MFALIFTRVNSLATKAGLFSLLFAGKQLANSAFLFCSDSRIESVLLRTSTELQRSFIGIALLTNGAAISSPL